MPDASRALSVLVAGTRWPPETFIARLVSGLLDAGVHVTVAASARPDASWTSRAGFSWLYAPAWRGGVGRRLWDVVRAAGSAALHSPCELATRWSATDGCGAAERLRVLHRTLPTSGRRWDVVYFPWNSAAIAQPELFDTGAAVVVSCRGAQVNVAPHNPERLEIRDGLRWTFARAAAVHCVSADIAAEATRYGLDPAKARIIRPAVDPEFFSPGGTRASPAPFTIVTTGSLIWRKGVEFALAAVRRLVDAGVDARFDIIGAGPERQRVLYTVQDLQLGPQVRLLGRLAPADVRDRLRAADAFLLTSLSEGISNAVLEAMACGVPIVTSDCGGMREAVTDGEEGFVVPVRDPVATADRLARLAADTSLRARMGAAARARVVRDFALEDQVRAFVQLLECAASARGVPVRAPASPPREVAPLARGGMR